ncbi:carbohydrate ABC transporter permease [Caldicellulosiruptoraceae bacterium PP1]
MNRLLIKSIIKNRYAYLYISPFYILFAIFGAFPIGYALYLSFFEWDGISERIYIGFTNYINIFSDNLFWKSILNTVIMAVLAHIPMLFLALLIAFLINTNLVNKFFKELLRTLYFMPIITSSVAVALVFMTLYGQQYGLINSILKIIGISPIDWWGGSGFFIKPAIIILFIWRWIGWNMVIYLAGFQSIPSDLYEAAEIDGATKIRVFFSIALPIIKPIILYTVIMSTIGGLTMFEEPFMLVGTSGGTNSEGLTMSLYLYSQAFEFSHFGYASAFGFLISLIIFLFSIINLKLFRTER